MIKPRVVLLTELSSLHTMNSALRDLIETSAKKDTVSKIFQRRVYRVQHSEQNCESPLFTLHVD